MNQHATNGLVQHWFPVSDARGHQHLEARWVAVGDVSMAGLLPHSAPAGATTHAAHAA